MLRWVTITISSQILGKDFIIGGFRVDAQRDRRDAVNFLGNMGIPVEHEAGRVRVGTEVLEDKPFVLFNTLELGVTQGAELVKTVASGTEHSSRDLFMLLLIAIELVKAGS